MPALQQQIAEKFLATLSASKAIDSDKIDEFKSLLSNNKKPKADDFCLNVPTFRRTLKKDH